MVPVGARKEFHPSMRTSSTISLFSEQPELNQRPYSFVFSILAHGVAFGLIFIGIISAPKVRVQVAVQRYEVRHLDLHTLEAEMQRARSDFSKETKAPRAPSKAPAPAKAQTTPPAASPDAPRPALRMVVQAPRGAQTLVQPDIPKPLALNVEIPVPTVVIWAGKKAVVKTIVPPLPEKPVVADVKPSTQLPNEEQNLAEIAIPAVAMPVIQPQPILPSTTTPLVVTGPKPTPPAPITTAQGSSLPTPAAVMSLSEHRMANGAVTLPPVNSSVATPSPGELAPAEAKNTTPAGHGSQTDKPVEKPAEKPVVKSADKAVGKPTDKPADHAVGKPTDKPADHAVDKANDKPADKSRDTAVGKAAAKPDSGKAAEQPDTAKAAQGANAGTAQKTTAPTGYGIVNTPTGAHITRPKEGQFGSVVVGSTLTEKYPETAELWSGRLSYTVYLPVGLAKSWILQYSLSRADSPAGATTRVEAPWPYNIVRPNIAPGTIDADALMIHGFVNQAGRFEALSIAFPPEFAQAQFVLNALNQWEFRPATQNGQNIKVEVLLIIPEVED
jgi:hypothetical protein